MEKTALRGLLEQYIASFNSTEQAITKIMGKENLTEYSKGYHDAKCDVILDMARWCGVTIGSKREKSLKGEYIKINIIEE